MVTPIRPSLSQALARPGAQQPASGQGADPRSAALDAQRAFFRNAMGQGTATPAATPQTQALRPQADGATNRATIQAQATQAASPRPGVFKAAEIARAQSGQAETPAPLRPGSLLNIIV